MSTNVLLIGISHAVFPIAGYFMNGKLGLLLGTILGILIAISLGGSKYSGIDIVGVGIGAVICFACIKENKK